MSTIQRARGAGSRGIWAQVAQVEGILNLTTWVSQQAVSGRSSWASCGIRYTSPAVLYGGRGGGGGASASPSVEHGGCLPCSCFAPRACTPYCLTLPATAALRSASRWANRWPESHRWTFVWSLVESEAEARKLEYSHSRRCRGASSNHPLSENYLRTSRAICTKTGQGRASKGKGFQTRQFRIETLVSQIKAGAWLRLAADGRSAPVEVRCLAADAASFFSPLKEGWGRVTFLAALLSSHFPHLSRWV